MRTLVKYMKVKYKTKRFNNRKKAEITLNCRMQEAMQVKGFEYARYMF